MKTLNIPLEDSEYAELEKLKGDKTWKSFLINSKLQKKRNKQNDL